MNQSSSSRLDRIKQIAISKEKASYPKGYLVKNETEQNSRMTALSRMRGKGTTIPKKVTSSGERVTFPDVPKKIILTVISTSAIRVDFTSPKNINTIYTIRSNYGDISRGTSSPITVSGLLSNTKYTFTVTATNILGTSSSAASYQVTTKPNAPTIGSSTVLTTTSVKISFTAPSGNGVITNYTVYSNPSVPSNTTGTSGTSSPITVSGLTANTIYTFYVTATNSGGTSSSSLSVSRDIDIDTNTNTSSTTSSTTISDPPSMVVATVISANIVNISFIEPLGTGIITGYTVTSNLGDIATGTSSPISVIGLNSNTLYTFTVSATNLGGTSIQSDESNSVTTSLSVPNTPTISQATLISDNEISVAFIAPLISIGTRMITYYTVTSSPGGFIETGKSSPISIIGLPSNTYTFTVSATNQDGTSPQSSESNIITTTETESPTIGIATVLGSSEVSVAFTILRGTGLTYTVISNPDGLIGTGTSSPITVSGLSSNTDYTFTVSATNIIGTASSGESSLVTTKPDAPIGSVTVLSSTEVSIDFTAIGSLTYTAISSPEGLTGTSITSPIIVSGLSSNTEYTFTITATNSSGMSIPSELNSATTKPESPTIGIITVLGLTDVSVDIIAPNSGIGGLTYTVVSNPDGLIGTGTSPILVSGLSSNTEYTFTAISTNSSGTSVSSNVSSSITTKPESPTIGIIKVLGPTEVSVDITAPSGNGSLIYTVTSNPEGLIGTGASSPIIVSGLSSNTEYTFSVIAINSGGTSISSGASSSITTKPESPTIGIITVLGPTEVSVSFTPNEPGTLIDYIVTSNLGDIGTGTSSPIIVSGLTSNTSYTFSVTATISDRTSFASSTSSSVTTKLSALIIDNIMVLRTSEINVSFTSPNGGDGTITYYNVTSSPGGLIGTGTSSPITVTGLSENTTYTFIVSAIRHMTSRRPIVLSVSNVSSPISTISDPPTLGIITVLDKTSVNIEFTPPSKGNGIITCYTATSSPRGLIGTGTSSPITITGLTPYESYTFTITATNSGGTSIQSNTSSYISPY